MNEKEVKVAFCVSNKESFSCKASLKSFYPFDKLDEKKMVAVIGQKLYPARYSIQLSAFEVLTDVKDLTVSKNMVLVELLLPENKQEAFSIGIKLGNLGIEF